MKFIVDPDIDIDLYFNEYPEVNATKVGTFKSEFQILNIWELNSPASSLEEDARVLIQKISYKPLTFSIVDVDIIQGQELESLLQIIKSAMKIKYHIIIPDLKYVPLDNTAFFTPYSKYYINFDPKIDFKEIIGYKLVSNKDVSFLNDRIVGSKVGSPLRGDGEVKNDIINGIGNNNYDVITWNGLSLTKIINPLYNQIMYDLSQIEDIYVTSLKDKKALMEIQNHWLISKDQLDIIEDPDNNTITCLVRDKRLIYEQNAKSLLSGLIFDINNGDIPRMKISVNSNETQDISSLLYAVTKVFIDNSPNNYIKSLAGTIKILPDMTIICPMCSFQSYLNFKSKLSQYLAKYGVLSSIAASRDDGEALKKLIVNTSKIINFFKESVLISINEIDNNRKDVVINYGQVDNQNDEYNIELTIREHIGKDELMDIINNIIYTEDILTDWGKCMISNNGGCGGCGGCDCGGCDC